MFERIPLKFRYLIAGTCSLLIGIVSLWALNNLSLHFQNEQAYIKKVTKKVQYELLLANKEIAKLQRRIETVSHINFSSVVKPSKYPYFIYKEHKLLFWSDYRLASDYSYLDGQYKQKLVALRNGKFLVKRSAFNYNNKLYEVFYLIPLSTKAPISNQYIKNHVNNDIFQGERILISAFQNDNRSDNIYSESGEYLFSIEFSNTSNTKPWWAISFIYLFFIVALFYIVRYVFAQYQIYIQQKHRINAILWITVWLTSVRALMLYFKFPAVITPLKLFNSKYFAHSALFPTIGDCLLNYIFLGIVLWTILYNFNYLKLTRRVHYLKSSYKQTLSILLVLFIHLNFHATYETIKIISLNAQWTLDITQDIYLNQFKVVSIIIFMLLAFCFFVVSHILCRFYITLNIGYPESWQIGLYLSLTAILAFFGYFIGFFEPLLLLGCTIFFVIQIEFKLTSTLRQFEFKTYLYFMLASIFCAFSAAMGTYRIYQQKETSTKEAYSNNLLAPNDVYGEYLLNVANTEIQSDGFIKSKLTSIFSSKDLIEQKIRKFYLSSYFDQYEVQIRLFDAFGVEIGSNKPETTQYADIYNQFARKRYSTEYKNLFLINESEKNISRNYLQFIPITKGSEHLGDLIIELKLKKIIPNSIYPTLLVDKKFDSQTINKNYSYAVYENDTMAYCAGNFNYQKNISDKIKEFSQSDEQSFNYKGYNHFVKTISAKKIILISSPLYPYTNVFSNFSFCLLVLILLTLLVMTAYTYYFSQRSIQINFTTKIQLYLNFVLFLTLLIVSIATLGAITNSYRNELTENFSKRANGISTSIAEYFDNYRKGRVTDENLSKWTFEMSRLSETDVNFFDPKGKLIFTSQPLIYEFGLFSGYLNPEAYSDLIELRNNKTVANESVGDLNYKNIYMTVKSFDNGELLGILSLPFFESASELENQLINVLTTIINIFVTVFVILVLLSYYVSSILTYPMVLLRTGLQKISLQDDNQPLSWNSTDEIGMLVNEYNQMLQKLVDSKKQLSRQEKESAWREMAQQVAHEIKNPLTPMKLTLQYLEKSIRENRDNVKAITEKTVTSLLGQIDTLSDIATSFSAFAKMPVPKYDQYDLVYVVKTTVHLFANNESTEINLKTDITRAITMGDEQLMGRIITNLLINALQAIPNDRIPEIQVQISQNQNRVTLSITDNGTGIPDDVIDKVFVPNFSTKYNGSGIGLALAKNGVQHAGGKIWFETVSDKGTTFFIELPLKLSLPARENL